MWQIREDEESSCWRESVSKTERTLGKNVIKYGSTFLDNFLPFRSFNHFFPPLLLQQKQVGRPLLSVCRSWWIWWLPPKKEKIKWDRKEVNPILQEPGKLMWLFILLKNRVDTLRCSLLKTYYHLDGNSEPMPCHKSEWRIWYAPTPAPKVSPNLIDYLSAYCAFARGSRLELDRASDENDGVFALVHFKYTHLYMIIHYEYVEYMLWPLPRSYMCRQGIVHNHEIKRRENGENVLTGTSSQIPHHVKFTRVGRGKSPVPRQLCCETITT